MKSNYHFVVLICFSFLFSCGKDETQTNSSSWDDIEIVQTDNSGNIISQGTSTDWSSLNINERQELMPLFNFLIYPLVDDGKGSFKPKEEVKVNIKTDCNVSNLIKVIAYPNPLPIGASPSIKVNSTRKIIGAGYSYKTKNGSVASSSYGFFKQGDPYFGKKDFVFPLSDYKANDSSTTNGQTD